MILGFAGWLTILAIPLFESIGLLSDDKECKKHEFLTDHRFIFMSNPPKYKLICLNCKIERFIECTEYDSFKELKKV